MQPTRIGFGEMLMLAVCDQQARTPNLLLQGSCHLSRTGVKYGV